MNLRPSGYAYHYSFRYRIISVCGLDFLLANSRTAKALPVKSLHLPKTNNFKVLGLAQDCHHRGAEVSLNLSRFITEVSLRDAHVSKEANALSS